MKVCIIYGNCQITPLRQNLMTSPTFNSLYNIIEVPPVHHCNPATGLPDELLQRCSLFIYQKVSDSYGTYLSTDYILSRLPPNCKTITFTSCYFAGIFPQHYTLDDTFPYADKNVIHYLNSGYKKEDIIEILSDERFYSKREVIGNLDRTILELRVREKGIHIPIADFLMSYFRDIPLFYTINHPNYIVSSYLARMVLMHLGLDQREIQPVTSETYCHTHIQPIYPSVAKHLGLQFYKPNERIYAINNVPATFQEYIIYLIDYLLAKK